MVTYIVVINVCITRWKTENISNVYKVFSVTPRPICNTRSVVVTPTKQQNTHNDPLFTFRSNVIMISPQDFIFVPGTGYIYYDLNITQLILENRHVCVSCYAVCPNHIYRYMCLNDHHDDLVLEYWDPRELWKWHASDL